MFNKIDDISLVYQNIENVPKKRQLQFSIFCQKQKNRKFNRLNVNFLFFSFLIQSGKNEKQKMATSIFHFFVFSVDQENGKWTKISFLAIKIFSVYDMKNSFCLFERHVEIQNSCVSLFEISFFVSEILTFFYYANQIGDDVKRFATKKW